MVSDFSFPAMANVVEDLGARPVFRDVRPDTFNMTVESLSASISKATKASIFVGASGNPSGLYAIKAKASYLGIPLIGDAACAIGRAIDGQKCGSRADWTCFSFDLRKLISMGEGGAITPITRNGRIGLPRSCSIVSLFVNVYRTALSFHVGVNGR